MIKNSRNDARIEKIFDMIFKIAEGDLDVSLSISDDQDEYDAIIIALNMMTEELKAKMEKRHDNN